MGPQVGVEEAWMDVVCDVPRLLAAASARGAFNGGKPGKPHTVMELIEESAPESVHLLGSCLSKVYLGPPCDHKGLEQFSGWLADDPLVLGGFIGIGPDSCGHYSEEVERVVRSVLELGESQGVPICAIGMIGLDFSPQCRPKHASIELQSSVLSSQLRIASSFNLPVLITAKLASEEEPDAPRADLALCDCFDTITGEGLALPFLILHLAACDGRFQSPSDLCGLMKRYPTLMVAFSGTLTHSKCSRDLLGLCFDCPMDRVLIGTGSPDFIPSAAVGRSLCLPIDAVMIAERIAVEKGGDTTVDLVLHHARENAIRIGLAKAAEIQPQSPGG